MSRTVPRPVGGVSADTPEPVRSDAGRRSGLSLGDWLDKIVAERASELGVARNDVDQKERLDAVAAELARFTGERKAPSRIAGGDGLRAAPAADTDELTGAGPSLDEDRAASPIPEPSSLPAALDRPPPWAERRGRSPTIRPADDRFVRNAVADIVRRQADLDEASAADSASPPVSAPPDEAEPVAAVPMQAERASSSVPARDVRALETALSALQARIELGDPRFATAPPQTGIRPVQTIAGAGDAVAARRPTALPRNVALLPESKDEEAFRADARNEVAIKDDVRSSGPVWPELTSFAAELREAIHRIDPRPKVDKLDERMRGLDQKIEALGAGLNDGGAIARIGEQTRDVRDLLTAAASRPMPLDGVERQLASLEARLDTIATASRSAVASPEADVLLGEIRGLIERFQPGATVDKLSRRMDELWSKLDGDVGGQTPVALIDQLSRRVEDVHASLRTHLSKSAIDTGPLEALVRGVGERIDDARRTTPDFQALEAAMRDLHGRLESARSFPDSETLRSLEAQFARLGERLEQSEGSVATLDSVEHSLAEVFTRLDETRRATIEAAETAARTAARDTLREAMHTEAVGLRPGEGVGAGAEQVARGLADLRERQEVADQRTQATLNQLNRAIASLVDCLSTATEGRRVETVASADRSAPAASPRVAPEHESADKPVGAAPTVRVDGGVERGRRPRREATGEAAPPDPLVALIEPGSGGQPMRRATDRARADAVVPPVATETPSVAAGVDGSASFIAAARRAAQAAQEKTAATKGLGMKKASSGAAPVPPSAVLERARAFLVHRRRPILLGVAGLVLLLGALEVVKISVGEPEPSQVEAPDRARPEAGKAGIAPLAPRKSSSLETAPASDVGAPRRAAAVPAPLPSMAAATLASPGQAAGAPSPGGAIDASLDGLPQGLRSRALGGDPPAAFEVALRFAEGRTVARDPKLAFGWFERAANANYAPAQYRLGSAYEKGVGVTRDTALALAWYDRAAAAGNIRAMHNLAVLSAEGATGKPDYAKAAQWFQKAAAFGVRDSQFNLAILYARGLGVEQSLTQSYVWFAIAGNQGDDDAVKKRDEVGQRLDPKALATAKATVEAFRPKSGESAANDASPPAGGWDAVAPLGGPGTAVKSPVPKVSSL